MADAGKKEVKIVRMDFVDKRRSAKRAVFRIQKCYCQEKQKKQQNQKKKSAISMLLSTDSDTLI